MLTSDPDRYYSPSEAANALVSLVRRFRHRNVLDSNCGSGSLLEAMAKNFPQIRCGGIDVDKDAISKLRRRRPEWTLVPGDALDQKTWSKFRKLESDNLDIAVLNPPFSMGGAKGLNVIAWGVELRCSLAMAHVLATLEFTSPKRVAAILPESWAYSGMDNCARRMIEKRYSLQIDRSFAASTFHGARVNSILVLLEKRTSNKIEVDLCRTLSAVTTNVEVIRGRLACFKTEDSANGVPFVHSTDLKNIDDVRSMRKVVPYLGNTLSGAVIFLPRVGFPKLENVKAVWLRSRIQPSDCVIALKFTSMAKARAAAEAISTRWDELLELYKGTGARYTTIDRLQEWLFRLEL